MENQEAKPVLVSLTKEDLQLLFEKAAEAGAKAGIEKYEEELKRPKFFRTVCLVETRMYLTVECYNNATLPTGPNAFIRLNKSIIKADA